MFDFETKVKVISDWNTFIKVVIKSSIFKTACSLEFCKTFMLYSLTKNNLNKMTSHLFIFFRKFLDLKCWIVSLTTMSELINRKPKVKWFFFLFSLAEIVQRRMSGNLVVQFSLGFGDVQCGKQNFWISVETKNRSFLLQSTEIF